MIDTDKNEVSTYLEACMAFVRHEWMCNEDSDLLKEYAKWKNEGVIDFYRTDQDGDGKVGATELAAWEWPDSHI